jgi:hypothetical protein
MSSDIHPQAAEGEVDLRTASLPPAEVGFGLVAADLAEAMASLQRLAATLDRLSYDAQPQMWCQFGESSHQVHLVLAALRDIAARLEDDFRHVPAS